MKKTLLAFVVLSVMLLVAEVAEVEADQSENITLTVTVAPALSVSLSSNSIALGTVAAGSTTETAEAIVATNDGSGVNEVFSLSHTASGGWASGTTPGDETYVLNADFADTVSGATWSQVNSVVSDSVGHGDSEKLWFQFKAPTSTTSTTEQSLSVTVNAQLP